jgi:deoxyribodipyrimidine photo-lyase
MQTYQYDSLQALNETMHGNLLVQVGNPRLIVPAVAKAVGASTVHISADFEPAGNQRDVEVEQELSNIGIALVRTGSPYAVAPGRVAKDDGTAYRVYSPFYKAWLKHGWRAPAAPAAQIEWLLPMPADSLPERPTLAGVGLPKAGELAALQRWEEFIADGLDAYADNRDRPDIAGTSGLSGALRFGEIHPRTLLADLGDSRGHEVFRKEIAWREFYADVLWHNPRTEFDYLDTRFATMEYDSGPEADERFAAWCAGKTGYPIVDAGMRQLLREGWMHNRVRMIVASFLIKDLHLEWTRGADWFMRHLRDADIASNQHGWQWTAGCGTDAAPYFRVFNPITQGLKFDADGDYVRRYIPELGHLAGKAAHEPWDDERGYAHGYPMRVVDHAAERAEALERYERVRGKYSQ